MARRSEQVLVHDIVPSVKILVSGSLAEPPSFVRGLDTDQVSEPVEFENFMNS